MALHVCWSLCCTSTLLLSILELPDCKGTWIDSCMGETARGLLERVTSALGRLSIQVSLNVSGNQSHGSVVIGEPASPQDFTSATSSPREPAGGQSPQPAASTTTTPAECLGTNTLLLCNLWLRCWNWFI